MRLSILLRRGHSFCRLGLTAQCSFQRLHGRANLLRITAGIGSLQGLGSLQHHAIACAQFGHRALAVCRLAVEGFIDGFAKRIPQLLLVLAVQGHSLRLSLPALLQRLDRIDAQSGCRTKGHGLINHCMAAGQAFLLCSFQGSSCHGNRLLPKGLQFRKQLLAHMAAFAPAITKLVEGTVDGFPVARVGMFLRPRLDLFDQRQALGLVLSGFGADLVKPRLHHLVRSVAGFVEFLPQAVVGSPALVCLFPLLAQVAQGFLHLAAAQGLALRAVEQGLSLGHQVFAHLVCAPALPAFQLTSRHQGRMHLLLQGAIDVFAMHLEHGAQRGCSPGTGLPMALGSFLFEDRQGFAHTMRSLFNHFRRDFGLGNTRRLGGRSGSSSLRGQAARGTQLIRPDGHWRQRCIDIFGGRHSLGQSGLECLPHHQQLGARRIEQGGETCLHTGPAGIASQLLRLFLPAGHIGTQQLQRRLSVTPGLGGKHFDALGQQHSRLTLHLNAVLQILDHLHAIRDLYLEHRQGLAGQRCARLGGITLPCQGIGNVELRGCKQHLRFFSPLGGNDLLALGAADFIEALTHRARGALVTPAQLFENLLQLLVVWLGSQPVTNAGGALA
ncbi:hypothetical protein D3C71_997840 [compost metagenome]